MPQLKFDTLIIDNDIDVRMRLKQATTALSHFGKMYHASSLNDALSQLKGEARSDVIFLSAKFNEADVADFIRQAKETAGGWEAAFVMVLEKNSVSDSSLAQKTIGGIDGLLFEPYSADDLMEITILATRVKKDRAVEREIRALRLIVKDLIRYLDMAARLRNYNGESSKVEEKLANVAKMLYDLQPESLKAYFQLSVDMFSSVPNPDLNSRGEREVRYTGISNRVKRRMALRILRDLN